MNCSYRILENVHIGASVRKTSDKSTVPFNNKPMTGVKIVSWNSQGFILSHPDIPEVPYFAKRREIWLNFDQFPLDKLNITQGIINNPLTFVESLVGKGGTHMVLIRADIFDYLELLDDKKIKDAAKKITVQSLVPGQKVLSCLCREGNPMYYIGTFNAVFCNQKYSYSNYNRGYINTIKSYNKRAFFAYLQPNGKFKVKQFSLTHKLVIELYDQDQDEHCSKFSNNDINLENLQELINYQLLSKDTESDLFEITTYREGIDYSICYIGKLETKQDDLKKETIEFNDKRNIKIS